MNTDKYEGVTRFDLVEQHNIHELAIYLLDQLAEVERLREEAKEVKEWVVRLERFQTMVGDYHLKAFIDAWDKVETGHKTTLEREEE